MTMNKQTEQVRCRHCDHVITKAEPLFGGWQSMQNGSTRCIVDGRLVGTRHEPAASPEGPSPCLHGWYRKDCPSCNAPSSPAALAPGWLNDTLADVKDRAKRVEKEMQSVASPAAVELPLLLVRPESAEALGEEAYWRTRCQERETQLREALAEIQQLRKRLADNADDDAFWEGHDSANC